MRKLFFLFGMVLLLFAGEYITLDDGKVILLKPDGTWQEVKVVKKGSETIAIKPDGTWEKIDAKKVEAANKLETGIDKKYKDEPLVKILMGKWRGDGIYYEFTPNHAFMKLKDGHSRRTIEGKWIIEKLDKAKKEVVVNIGEGARLGFLTFGGDIRKFKIINDHTIQDITSQLDGKVYTLTKER